MTDSTTAPSLLEARAISKSFPGVQALTGVDLSLGTGEVLAVVGENGAGKSTLMKILAGIQRADSGSIHLAGQPFAPQNVTEGLNAGVALIHQELNLAGNLDIASNIMLGREPRTLGFIDRRETRRRAAAVLADIGLAERVDRRVDELSIGHRQLVEIAKALSINARVLIMDEPTSSLTLREAARLFEVVRNLKSRGVGIIYISHRLAEVEQIADRVLVLRDGRVSGHQKAGEVDRERMMRMMVGRELSHYARQAEPTAGDVRLQVRGLRTRRFPALSVSFDVRGGEIAGLAGLVGAGRTELLESLFGITPPRGGDITIDGNHHDIRSPIDAVAAGLALLPEDRQQHGLLLEQSIRRNVGLAELARQARASFINRTRERAIAREMIGQLNVRCTNDRQITQTLSGGNQQKVVLGKWLTMQPRVLLLDEPTRGVDVGARSEIYRIIEALAAHGAAVLFASSDLEEVIAMSDRVLVMRDGAITGAIERDQLSEESIMRLATMTDISGAPDNHVRGTRGGTLVGGPA